VDGRMRVIEYSDLPASLADRRTSDQSPAFWAGSIAVHVFDVDFLARMAQSDVSLPFHRAKKKVPYNEIPSGRRIEPSEPNAIKFERFIFDLMPQARNPLVVEVDPAEGFAPVKNASSEATDTPETARRALAAKHRRWLIEAGAEVDEGVTVEISPLFALSAEQLREKLPPGTRIERDTFLAEPPT